MVGCSAPNCQNKSENGFRLFRFPEDVERREHWLINCRCDKWKPSYTSRLCQKHCEDNQYECNSADGWQKLKSTAIPTIFAISNPSELTQSTRRVLKRCAQNSCQYDHYDARLKCRMQANTHMPNCKRQHPTNLTVKLLMVCYFRNNFLL